MRASRAIWLAPSPGATTLCSGVSSSPTPSCLDPSLRSGQAPGDPQSLNRYSYAGNNPVRYTDPSGHRRTQCGAEGDECAGSPPHEVQLGNLAAYTWSAETLAYAQEHIHKNSAVDYAVFAGGSGVILAAPELVEAAPLLIDAAPDLVETAYTAAHTGLGQAMEIIAGALCADGDCGNEVESAYGDLSRAEEFGIRTYRELYRFTKGTGLQRHHIIERRFADVGTLDINPNEMLSVAVTHEEHQVLTNLWRQAIGYNNSLNPLNTATASVQDIWGAAQSIYQNYPALLEAARRTLFGP